MATDTPSTPDASSTRSWSWVSSKTFAATPFYRRGWSILKQDWLVFIWKLAADFAVRATTLIAGLLVLGLFVLDFQLFVDRGRSPFAWVGHIVELVTSPGFIIGVVGFIFFVNLVGVALQAWIVGGIWGLLGRGLADEPIQMGPTFWKESIDWFPDVLGLFLIRFALRTITSLLGIALALLVIRGMATGLFAELPGWQSTLLLTGAVGFYAAWAGLTRLVVEVAGAPLVLDDTDPGEAIVRAAAFVVDNFWSLYRILIFALGLLLVPLFLYWAAIMVNNLSMIWPAIETPGTILQFFGEILLTVAVTVVGVLFYGAVFAFYRYDDDAFDRFGAPSDDADDTDDADPSPDLFERGATLREFLPDESPHRFVTRRVLPTSTAADEESDPPELTEPSTADDTDDPSRQPNEEDSSRQKNSRPDVDDDSDASPEESR